MEPQFRNDLEALHSDSFGWAVRCCGGDRVMAQDVLQSVYLKILEGRAVFRGASSLKSWLFAVIRKTAAGERRRMILRRILPLNHEVERELSSGQETPIQSLEAADTLGHLHQSLASLPRRQQEVLHLVFYSDLSIALAAEVMHISVGSARTHYERGKARLRELLMQEGVYR